MGREAPNVLVNPTFSASAIRVLALYIEIMHEEISTYLFNAEANAIIIRRAMVGNPCVHAILI